MPKKYFPGKKDIYRLEIKIAESKDSTYKIIAGIELKIAESRDFTNKLIIESREETNKKFAVVNLKIAEYHTKIVEPKNDLIKWFFTLILGSTIAAIVVAISILKVR